MRLAVVALVLEFEILFSLSGICLAFVGVLGHALRIIGSHYLVVQQYKSNNWSLARKIDRACLIKFLMRFPPHLLR